MDRNLQAKLDEIMKRLNRIEERLVALERRDGSLSISIPKTVRRTDVRVADPSELYPHVSWLGECDKEIVMAVYLDMSYRIVESTVMSVGDTRASAINANDIMRKAVELNAAYVVVVHNHPQIGYAMFSNQDIIATNRLGEALGLIGIRLLDHLVINESGYLSMSWLMTFVIAPAMKSEPGLDLDEALQRVSRRLAEGESIESIRKSIERNGRL